MLPMIPRRDSEGMLFKSKDTFINLIRSLLSSVWWQKYGQSGVVLTAIRPSTPFVLGLKASCVVSLIWQYWEFWIERHQESQLQLRGEGCYDRFLLHVNGEAQKIFDSKLDWKRSVFNPVPKKDNAKEYSHYHTIALISHASKVMLKIHQVRLQKYVNWELLVSQARFRKGRGTRDQIANICWIIEKAKEFQKNIYFCFIDYANAFDCVGHNKLWKILRDGNTRPPYLPPEKSACRSRSNS